MTFFEFDEFTPRQTGDSSVGTASLRMTAVTERGMQRTESRICENSLFV